MLGNILLGPALTIRMGLPQSLDRTPLPAGRER